MRTSLPLTRRSAQRMHGSRLALAPLSTIHGGVVLLPITFLFKSVSMRPTNTVSRTRCVPSMVPQTAPTLSSSSMMTAASRYLRDIGLSSTGTTSVITTPLTTVPTATLSRMAIPIVCTICSPMAPACLWVASSSSGTGKVFESIHQNGGSGNIRGHRSLDDIFYSQGAVGVVVSFGVTVCHW